MPGPAPAVAAVRVAVRTALRAVPPGSVVLVACSGGADSLALAAAAAFEAPKLGIRAGAVIIDHGLQPGSGQVAARAADQCRSHGLNPVEVVPVTVEVGRSGPEDAARTSRYAALREAASRHTAAVVLLGHTRDDQAEQVLLGLARGSGARSLSGMPAARDGFVRPLLGISRAQTEAACLAQGLDWWADPHNDDLRYTRVRARRLLADAEQALGPGLIAALARSAELLRDDADVLDEIAATRRAQLGTGPIDVTELRGIPPGLRRRVWRLLATDAGAQPLSATHVAALDDLVTGWRGQGPVDLPGGVQAERRDQQVVWHRRSR